MRTPGCEHSETYALVFSNYEPARDCGRSTDLVAKIRATEEETMSTQVDRQVERIAGYARQTRVIIEGRSHKCKWDAEGRCLYCSERSGESALMPQGRTGELG